VGGVSGATIARNLGERLAAGSNNGVVTEKSAMEKKMADWVRRTGFRSQKFLGTHDFNSSSMLFTQCVTNCMEFVNDAEWSNKKDSVFARYGACIRKALGHKRNCTQTLVRKKLKGTKEIKNCEAPTK
jgi:hypothetical protein